MDSFVVLAFLCRRHSVACRLLLFSPRLVVSLVSLDTFHVRKLFTSRRGKCLEPGVEKHTHVIRLIQEELGDQRRSIRIQADFIGIVRSRCKTRIERVVSHNRIRRVSYKTNRFSGFPETRDGCLFWERRLIAKCGWRVAYMHVNCLPLRIFPDKEKAKWKRKSFVLKTLHYKLFHAYYLAHSNYIVAKLCCFCLKWRLLFESRSNSLQIVVSFQMRSNSTE